MNTLNIPKNLKGRDFVCGDLHGSYQRLLAALEYIKFDKNVDRMFSVGDLVDRGPENLECLRLLDEPWFFAVKGNHEQMMCDFYSSGPYSIFWARNGGLWGAIPGDDTPEIMGLATKASKLPLMISVEMEDDKFFHVIHAELSSKTPLTDLDLENEEEFNRVAFAQCSDGDFIQWGRSLFYDFYAENLTPQFIAKRQRGTALNKLDALFSPKLSHIYSGHTPVQRPVQFKGQTNLDTRAFGSFLEKNDPYGLTPPPKWMGLTVTEPLTNKFWLSNYYGVEEVEAVQV